MQLTSDTMEPSEALRLLDLIRDPAFRTQMDEVHFEEYLHTLAVTSGIVHAIDASRNTP